ncbi:MAG: hypothetical protein RL758_119 [Pseudomonadota bacterium]
MSRIRLAGLSLSAAALIGLAVHEGYRETAYIPVKGDVPTIGFGDTHGVKPGDKTDPVRALIRMGQHAENFQRDLRKCIGDVPMHQHEWDAIVSWAYNVGTPAACSSTLVRKLKAFDYPGACAELLRWDRFKGQPLPGLTKRRQAEHRQCMGTQ